MLPHTALKLSLVIAIVPWLGVAPNAQEWTPAGSKGDVRLEVRDAATLGAREMRAIATLPHAASRISAVVCDFTQVLDPDVRESTILSGNLQGDYVVHLRYAPRFVVVASRDVVIGVQRHPAGCSWSEQRDVLPERPGTVRMPLLRGAWTLEPLADGGSRVVYRVAVNPGGRIPGWLVRRGALSALPDIIERLSRCLARTSSVGDRC